MQEMKSISFIGAGNVAFNLAQTFHQKGITIKEVYSRTLDNAKMLGDLTNAQYTDDIARLNTNSDLYIVALRDDIVNEVLSKLPDDNLTLAHTSGSFQTKELLNFSNNVGCIYPLQTMNKSKLSDLSAVNFFLEATQKELQNKLEILTKKISSEVHFLNSEQREKLHISAVGVNNFTHFLLSKSKEYCLDNNLDFSFLHTLLNQTVENIKNSSSPLDLQTGPARRGDVKIIKEHLSKLDDGSDFQELYKSMSQLILNKFHGNKYQL